MYSLLTITAEELAASNEARGSEQRDLFLIEAEALATATSATPAEKSVPDVEVAPHKRNKHGRNPLDPALEREIVRHELTESEHFCPMTALPWSRSVPRSASRSTSSRSRCG